MCIGKSEVNVLGLTTNLKLYQHLIKRMRNGEDYRNCKEANNRLQFVNLQFTKSQHFVVGLLGMNINPKHTSLCNEFMLVTQILSFYNLFTI